MTNVLWDLVIFWGVWLFVPVLVDGGTTLASIAGVLAMQWRRKTKGPARQLEHFPFVTLILPVYNSSDTLEACLHSIDGQDYPSERMEVLLINNGSTDSSFDVFARLQAELDVRISWHSIMNQGKAWALNAGIHLARGTYIFNVDSDVVLKRDAVRAIVEAMEADRELGAVTGAIQVLPPSADASPFRRTLAGCEFLEYLSAFHVGREHQTLLQSLYTLSGAFSVFRRDILLKTFLYSQETVTEDTDLTFELYERVHDCRIGCVSRAVAYTHPIESLGDLYAQRVRWQRGQIEVSARHETLLDRPMWSLRGFSPARILMVDHTLAFPRLVWMFYLPVLVVFEYPLSLIVAATLAVYLLYLSIDLLWIILAWYGADPTARRRLRETWWLLPVLPAYRILVFLFRFSGFLHAVAETGTWHVSDPVTKVRTGLLDARRRLQQAYEQVTAVWIRD